MVLCCNVCVCMFVRVCVCLRSVGRGIFIVVISELTYSFACFQKKNSLKTVGDMKTFVSQDLGRLKQQQAALSHRKFQWMFTSPFM